MTFATADTIEALYKEALNIKVVDCHTHIQDDLQGFDQAMAARNLAGTQASFNAYPAHIVETSLKQKCLVRRLMMDATHGLSYSWFGQIVEGRHGAMDSIIARIGDNSQASRTAAGRMLVHELQDSRHSEYAEWIRTMFSFYCPGSGFDPLDPANYDTVCDALLARRNDPAFAAKILKDNNVVGYVTSIENRANIPLDSREVSVDKVDVSWNCHPESFNMFDAHYIIWPQGATDFGLFLSGHKYEAERYVLNLEERLGVSISNAASLKKAIKDFLWKILWSPKTNPQSRIRYTNVFQPVDLLLNQPYSVAAVNTALSYSKASLCGDNLAQVVACATEGMFEALDEIGAEIRQAGHEYGSCFQIALGVTYFMDRSREIQSMPVYRQGMPQEAYSLWTNYPNIHFEYILSNETLYRDFSNTAKQVANISVGPWWHYFRRHNIAAMLYDQLSMGSVASIASGFTDARFVEMLVAKYSSVRRGIAMALAELVDDPYSSLFKKRDRAVTLMEEIMFRNPVAIHHLDIQTGKAVTGG